MPLPTVHWLVACPLGVQPCPHPSLQLNSADKPSLLPASHPLFPIDCWKPQQVSQVFKSAPALTTSAYLEGIQAKVFEMSVR